MPMSRVIQLWSPAFVILIFATLPRIQAGFALEDSGDQFSNNLFSDLAPIITLFGEQVSKQFILNSTSFVDNIIFAMAPLGIITAVVSAIRVGGPPWLRGLIGRAHESRSDVEVELMSSTSHDVCELWREEGLVRVKGSPRIAQLLFQRNGDSWQVHKLEEPSARELYDTLPGNALEDTERDEHHSVAPNLVLNLVPQPTMFERWLIATFGIALQCGALVFTGLGTYRLRLLKGGFRVTDYSYPLMAAGTVAVCVGMIICTHIIESSTCKMQLRLKDQKTRVV